MAAFDEALPFVLRWEGGLVDDPDDAGGRTNKGVTQRVYDRWRARQGLQSQDVQAIDNDELRAIYEADYWLPPRCDVLYQPLDLVQFDTAVNMGPRRAVRFLQMAVGCPVDGVFGPMTKQATDSRDAASVVEIYCGIREQFYRDIVAAKPSQKKFLKGWLNRLNSLRQEAGMPGLESAEPLDFGDAPFIRRIPDFGEDPEYDL